MADRHPPRNRLDLVDPGALAQLSGTELIASRIVEGFLQGLHRSPHRGFSAEFAELRAYRPGDDLRHVDWRMYARSDRFYVKQYEEDTNLRAHILLDVSASMAWSSSPGKIPDKFWYARQLAAALSLLLLRQGDAVGLLAFDDAIRDRVLSRGGRRHWKELLHRLDALRPGGATHPEGALREIALRLRRRGLVILISDLLAAPEETWTALRFLRHRGHEVLVFHLMDPGERELPPGAELEFYDPERGAETAVSAGHLRARYKEEVRAALAEWERALRPAGIDYLLLETDRPFSVALRAYLRKRARLG